MQTLGFGIFDLKTQQNVKMLSWYSLRNIVPQSEGQKKQQSDDEETQSNQVRSNTNSDKKFKKFYLFEQNGKKKSSQEDLSNNQMSNDFFNIFSKPEKRTVKRKQSDFALNQNKDASFGLGKMKSLNNLFFNFDYCDEAEIKAPKVETPKFTLKQGFTKDKTKSKQIPQTVTKKQEIILTLPKQNNQTQKRVVGKIVKNGKKSENIDSHI